MPTPIPQGRTRSNPIHAIDFGTGAALAIHGPAGPVLKPELKLPRVVGGKTARDEFRLVLRALLERGDVVIESPTVGSSGAERQDVKDELAKTDHLLYAISARAVKNYRMDRNLPNPKSYPKYETDEVGTQIEAHVLDAEILYRIATEEPWRLRLWREGAPIDRIHTSVRPMDKRGYSDERALEFLSSLPPFPLLPKALRESPAGNGDGRRPSSDYRPKLAVPFAMALCEPYVDDGPDEERRQRFQKVLGASEHGYPSFYRRMWIEWMQLNAKRMAEVTRMTDVPREMRRSAFRLTQKQVRHLFHLAAS